MDVVDKNILQISLMRKPCTISSLIEKTGGIKELIEFFQWIYDTTEMIRPQILQDQTTVLAGRFCPDDGNLMYRGYAITGDRAECAVKVTDLVMVG